MTDELLIPRDVYLKSGVHIGTKLKTKYMEKFIYKTREDGLSVFNIGMIDQRIKDTISMFAEFEPSDILIVGRRETAWRPVKLAGKLLGFNFLVNRYPPGRLTNPTLKNYAETKIVLVVDPIVDRNVISDALKIGIPVIALSDTNNVSNNVDLVVPFNNKGRTSIGLFFYLVCKEYMKKKGMIKDDSEFEYSLEDFTKED